MAVPDGERGPDPIRAAGGRQSGTGGFTPTAGPFGNPVKDYIAQIRAVAREREEKALTLRRRPSTATPPALLDAYAGIYYSLLLKDAAV